jgi:hypothetical protein
MGENGGFGGCARQSRHGKELMDKGFIMNGLFG